MSLYFLDRNPRFCVIVLDDAALNESITETIRLLSSVMMELSDLTPLAISKGYVLGEKDLALLRKMNRRNPLHRWLNDVANFAWAVSYLGIALDEYQHRNNYANHPQDELFPIFADFSENWRERDRFYGQWEIATFPNWTEYKTDDLELAFRIHLSEKWRTYTPVWTTRPTPLWWNNPLLIVLDDADKMG